MRSPARRPRVSVSVAAVLAGALLLGPTSAASSAGGSSPLASAAVQVPHGPLLQFDKVVYAATDCAALTLSKTGLPKGSHPLVRVGAKATGDKVVVKLRESQPGSGVFVTSKCVRIRTASAKSDAILQVEAGDFLVALYEAPKAKDASGLATDGASVAGGSSSGRFTAKIDPSIMPAAFQALAARLGHPDLPLAMVVDAAGTPSFFGENQVVIQETRPGDVAGFLGRHGGTEIGRQVIPAGGSGRGATFAVIRLTPSPMAPSRYDHLIESVSKADGTYRYSSAEARDLMGLIAEEQIGGLVVTPNALLLPQEYPVSDEGAGGNLFANKWYDPTQSGYDSVHGGEAQAMLSVLDTDAGSRVPVATIDSGFAAPLDFTPPLDSPDYGAGGFMKIPQGSVDASGMLVNWAAGAAGGKSQLPCSGTGTCNWHGMEMFSVTGGRFNNGYGSAGIGGQVADPMFVNVAFPYTVSAARGIVEAVTHGARVVSLSSGFPCMPLILDLCDSFTVAAIGLTCLSLVVLFPNPLILALGCSTLVAAMAFVGPAGYSALSSAVSFADAMDVVVVAAAGNTAKIGNDSYGPGDVGAYKIIPCVLGNVVCVGNLAVSGGAPMAAPSSFYGPRVNVWAPGTSVASAPTPDDPSKNAVTDGTSPATAYLAGVVAIARKLAPKMPAKLVRALLAQAACTTKNQNQRVGGGTCQPSSDPLVDNAGHSGFIDVLEVIRLARVAIGRDPLVPCTGGWDVREKPASDTPPDAYSLGVLSPLGGATATDAGDRSIHSLTKKGGPPGDEDWYSFRISAPSGGKPSTWFVRATVTVPDPSVGDLRDDFFVPNPKDPAHPIPVTPLQQQSSGGGAAYVKAALTVETDYLVRIEADGAPVENDNCYSGIEVRILDPAPEPTPSPPPCSDPAGCPGGPPTATPGPTTTPGPTPTATPCPAVGCPTPPPPTPTPCPPFGCAGPPPAPTPTPPGPGPGLPTRDD